MDDKKCEILGLFIVTAVFVCFFAVLCFLNAMAAFAMPVDNTVQSPVSWVDGKIVFRSDYKPSNFELNLASSGLKFSNYSDFSNCINDNQATINKIMDLKYSEAVKLAVSTSTLLNLNDARVIAVSK